MTARRSITSVTMVVRVTMVVLAALGLTACSGGTAPTNREVITGGGRYLQALALAESGACAEALPTLRCLAYEGPGYEGPQYVLGYCLLEQAQSLTDATAKARQSADGLMWIRRAADAGWQDAQDRLVHLYTEGKWVPRDPAEAEKWLILFENNPMRLSLGLPRTEGDVRLQLSRLLTPAEKAEGAARAGAWQRTQWHPGPQDPLPESCTKRSEERAGPPRRQTPPPHRDR